jgi:hypothetical protein
VEVVQLDQLRIRIFCLMTSDILCQHSLPPITASLFPMAALTIVTEVYATNTFKSIQRDDVEDVIFVLPSAELESGNVFITGSTNLYFLRYFVDNNTATTFSSAEFFGWHVLQPLTVRLFHALNMLSCSIKKLMYH